MDCPGNGGIWRLGDPAAIRQAVVREAALYYWSAAVSFKLFGVSEATARLPSAVFAFVTTLGAAWLAWRFYGAETVRWLLLLLPTGVGMIGFSHAAATDMPFTAMLTLAMAAAATMLGLIPRADRAGVAPVTARRSWTSLCFGIFLGLAVLAKGPAAIVLCGGAIFFWAMFTKRWSATQRLFHPATIADDRLRRPLCPGCESRHDDGRLVCVSID